MGACVGRREGGSGLSVDGLGKEVKEHEERMMGVRGLWGRWVVG